MSNDIEEIKRKVMHPGACEFHISRAPKKEVDIFKKYANEHYMGDYGALFKQLVQQMIVQPSQLEHVFAILEDMESRLENVEGKNTKQDNNKRVKKTVSGQKIEW